MTKKHPIFIACVIITVLCFAMGIALISYRAPREQLMTENSSVMIAEGTFDRVELVDRHFGSFNGQEVEGDVLAVLYEDGSIEISRSHYKVYGQYENTTNYPFFLYVYDGVDHLRERISVEGGTPEDFIYLNVTVSISLDYVKVLRVVDAPVGFEWAMILFVIGVFSALFAFMIETW